jgi:uncharacterized protein YcfJ
MSHENYCNDARCERTRRGEKHVAHSLIDQDKNTLQSLRSLLELGSNLTGGSIGAATGLLIGGSAGAIAGGLAGTIIQHILKQIGNDVSARFLSPREQMRIGGVMIHACNKINQKRDKGAKIREDDL